MGLLTFTYHPGEILRSEYMQPLGLTAGKLAKMIDVPRSRVEALSRGERAMSADTAWRLSKLFRTTPEFWMNMQRSHDLAQCAQEDYASIMPMDA